MLIPTDPPSGDPNEWVLSGRSIDSEEWGVKLIALTRVHRGPSLLLETNQEWTIDS